MKPGYVALWMVATLYLWTQWQHYEVRPIPPPPVATEFSHGYNSGESVPCTVTQAAEICAAVPYEDPYAAVPLGTPGPVPTK